MPKHCVIVTIDDTNCKRSLMATFKGTVDEVPISGEIHFRWTNGTRYKGSKAIYSVKSDNKLLTKHPDYREIRREILRTYRAKRRGLASEAEIAIER